MVLNPFLNILCQRLECRNIGGHNIGVSLYKQTAPWQCLNIPGDGYNYMFTSDCTKTE